MAPTKADVMACIAKLEDLKRQATVERSHYYTGATVTEAIQLLYAYLSTFREV